MYTPSVECAVGETRRKTRLVLTIMSCSCEKRYQPLSTFPYSKQWKAGWVLGMRLTNNYVFFSELHSKFRLVNPLQALLTLFVRRYAGSNVSAT